MNMNMMMVSNCNGMNMNMMMVSNSNSITVGVGCRSSQFQVHIVASPTARSRVTRSFNILSNPTATTQTLTHTPLKTPISALNSGLEASLTNPSENSSTFTNANIVLESGDENKIQLRVDLTGDQTQKVFDKILTNLARTAPPVPGFRMQKGGKSSKIPKSFLIQMLGEERVTKFVIQEILNSTMADYARKENLDVKDWKIRTTQTAEELKKSFTAGNAYGFNVIIEPENS